MRASNASQNAKRDCRRYRLENETVDEKSVVLRNIETVVVVSGSRRLQKTELQDLQLGVVMYADMVDATLLDVSGSPDLTDINMNVTECYCVIISGGGCVGGLGSVTCDGCIRSRLPSCKNNWT